MGKRPIIGISGNVTKENSYSLKHTYFDAILAAGGMPVLLPLTDDPAVIDDMLDHLDGVLYVDKMYREIFDNEEEEEGGEA